MHVCAWGHRGRSGRRRRWGEGPAGHLLRAVEGSAEKFLESHGFRRRRMGIRTLEGLVHPTRFPSVRHRPLGEFSRRSTRRQPRATRKEYIGTLPILGASPGWWDLSRELGRDGSQPGSIGVVLARPPRAASSSESPGTGSVCKQGRLGGCARSSRAGAGGSGFTAAASTSARYRWPGPGRSAAQWRRCVGMAARPDKAIDWHAAGPGRQKPLAPRSARAGETVSVGGARLVGEGEHAAGGGCGLSVPSEVPLIDRGKIVLATRPPALRMTCASPGRVPAPRRRPRAKPCAGHDRDLLRPLVARPPRARTSVE